MQGNGEQPHPVEPKPPEKKKSDQPKPDEAKTGPVTHIVKRATYIDNYGRVIQENKLVSGQPPKDYVRFSGTGQLRFELMPGQSGTKRFLIPLPNAHTIEEAFDQVDIEFPKAKAKATKAVRQEIAELMQKQGQGEGPGIAMPSGILGPGGTFQGEPPPSGTGRRGRKRRRR